MSTGLKLYFSTSKSDKMATKKQENRQKDYSEKWIEEKLRERIENLDGWCIKMVPSSRRGIPDRLIFIPGGGMYLVELKKTVNGHPTELSDSQKVAHKKLNAMGIPVWVIYDMATMDAFIEYVIKFT